MGDPRLLQVADTVTDFGSSALRGLIDDMLDTMRAAWGVGLAAPQIGVSLQVVIFGFEHSERYPDAPPVPLTVLINPAVVSALETDRFIGEHENFHSGERFTFTAAHAQQLAEQIALPDPRRTWLLLETGDTTLDYHAAQAHWFGCRQSVFEGGDHSFTRFPQMLPQLIEFTGL